VDCEEIETAAEKFLYNYKIEIDRDRYQFLYR